MKNNAAGFTLIELMIVVAIISILAGISIPQFANLVAKSQEGVTKANLGVLRSALSIYYGDNEGSYPHPGGGINLTFVLTNGGRYLQSIPNAYFPKTPNSVGHPTINTYSTCCGNGTTLIPAYLANGTEIPSWVYDWNPADPTWGMIIAGCTHSDLKGQPWYDN